MNVWRSEPKESAFVEEHDAGIKQTARAYAHPNQKGNRMIGLLVSRYVLKQPCLDMHEKRKRLADVNQLLNGSFDVVSAKYTAH
jgi:hypothetical protein